MRKFEKTVECPHCFKRHIELFVMNTNESFRTQRCSFCGKVYVAHATVDLQLDIVKVEIE